MVAGGEEPLALELEHFVNCVTRGEKPIVNGNAGLAAMEAALKVSEKIKEGLVAYFPSSDPLRCERKA